MAFGNISTFYLPTAANAGSSQWGSDVRKLLDSADTGNDATTKTNHGTGGAVTRTLDPYTTKATDDTQANFGWAVTPSDMNSVSGARRFIKSGDHTITLRSASSTAMLAAEATFTLYIYRVGSSPGRARTLLGSGSSAAINMGLANTYNTVSWSVNLPEVLLEDDETLQYSVEVNCQGNAIVGKILTHDTGTQGGVAIRVDHPGLGILADGDGTASGSATASGVTGKVLGADGSSSGAGTVSGDAIWTAAGVGSSVGAATDNIVAASTWSSTGTSAGQASDNVLTSKVLGTVGTVDVSGGGTVIRPAFGTFT